MANKTLEEQLLGLMNKHDLASLDIGVLRCGERLLLVANTQCFVGKDNRIGANAGFDETTFRDALEKTIAELSILRCPKVDVPALSAMQEPE